MRPTLLLILLVIMCAKAWSQEHKRLRAYGVKVGVLEGITTTRGDS